LALHVAGRLLAEEARLGWSVDDLIALLRDNAVIIKAKARADAATLRSR
jgi:hypothetical protein